MRLATCTCVACKHHPAEPVTADCRRYIAVDGSKAHCAFQPEHCAAFTTKFEETDPEPVPTGEFEQPALLF